MNLDKLKEPFPIEKISWRVGTTNKKSEIARTGNKNAKPTKGIGLAYIDARDVMERLDEVCGVSSWQDDYPFKGCCKIGINIGSGQWVWKANGAGETRVEADKGQYSDAFKRAGVMWGIGRYLYSMPNIWVYLDEKGNIKKDQIIILQNALAELTGQKKLQDPKKRTAAENFLEKCRSDMLVCNTPEQLQDWSAAKAKEIASLKKYEDLFDEFNEAYIERHAAVAQAPL